MIEVAKSFRSSEWALWREVMLPYTLPYTMTGVRQAIGRALVGMIAAEFFLSSTGLGQLIMGASQDFDTAGVFASILVIGLIGVGLTRLATGLAILLAWEIVVRAFAPAYVAKPSTVLLAIPRVIVDPAFLQALGATLAAVAEGLAITIVAGTIIGLLMGRSNTVDRMIRVYINGFNAMPMIIVLPLFSLWFGYSSAARIGTIIFAAIFAITMNVADGARSV